MDVVSRAVAGLALLATGCSLASLADLSEGSADAATSASASSASGTGPGGTGGAATTSVGPGGSSVSSSAGEGAGGSSSEGGGGSAGDGGAEQGGGGGGGSADPICGDGKIDPGEECDDGDDDPDDPCHDCVVQCSGSGFHKEPSTFHCYHLGVNLLDWPDARKFCESIGPGWTLATIRSPEELEFVEELMELQGQIFIWIGGNDVVNEGRFVWVSGEPWEGVPWDEDQGDEAQQRDCVEVNIMGLATFECDSAEDDAAFCEASPEGEPAR